MCPSEAVAERTRRIVLAPDVNAAAREAMGADYGAYADLDEPRCQV